jgi:hypothetical protein
LNLVNLSLDKEIPNQFVEILPREVVSSATRADFFTLRATINIRPRIPIRSRHNRSRPMFSPNRILPCHNSFLNSMPFPLRISPCSLLFRSNHFWLPDSNRKIALRVSISALPKVVNTELVANFFTTIHSVRPFPFLKILQLSLGMQIFKCSLVSQFRAHQTLRYAFLFSLFFSVVARFAAF